MRGIGQSYEHSVSRLGLKTVNLQRSFASDIANVPIMSIPPPTVIDSPCIRNCCLDDDDICLGCGRSLSEITRWSTTTNANKQIILAAAAERRQLIRLRHQLK